MDAATFLLDRLPHRFKLSLEMIAAAILDPAIQHLPAVDEWLEENYETRESALNRVARELEINVETVIASAPSNQQHDLNTHKKNADIRSLLIKKHLSVTKKSSNIEDELNRFMNITDEVSDVLQFWCDNVSVYPTMARIAKVLLCKPATSAKSESAFSVAGALLRHRRASIHPLRAQKTLFIHDNYKILRPYFEV